MSNAAAHHTPATGKRTLSEYESKRLLAGFGIPVSKEFLVHTRDEAVARAREIGYPVVLKGSSETIAHKTESGIVRLNLASDDAVADAFDRITALGLPLEGMLVQEMVSGQRELVMGLVQDPSFGPCVMFGIGGIFTEVFRDTVFRVAPLTGLDAAEMIDEVKASRMLGEFRGLPAVDRQLLTQALIGLGRIGMERPDILEIDINPLIVRGNRPVAVDALVVVAGA